jgi:hypothetical protein
MRPRGLKPALVWELYAALEAPLFHGAPNISPIAPSKRCLRIFLRLPVQRCSEYSSDCPSSGAPNTPPIACPSGAPNISPIAPSKRCSERSPLPVHSVVLRSEETHAGVEKWIGSKGRNHRGHGGSQGKAGSREFLIGVASCYPRRLSGRRGRLPGECRRGRCASCASCLLFVFRGACACG